MSSSLKSIFLVFFPQQTGLIRLISQLGFDGCEMGSDFYSWFYARI